MRSDGFTRGFPHFTLHLFFLPPGEEGGCFPFCHDCKFPEASQVMQKYESIQPLSFIYYLVSGIYFFFFFETEFRSCYPGWSAMVPS